MPYEVVSTKLNGTSALYRTSLDLLTQFVVMRTLCLFHISSNYSFKSSLVGVAEVAHCKSTNDIKTSYVIFSCISLRDDDGWRLLSKLQILVFDINNDYRQGKFLIVYSVCIFYLLKEQISI